MIVTDKDFSKEFDSNFIRHLADYIEPLIEAVCIGSGADRKWLEEQDAQVLVELTAKIIEVNVDFFVGVLGAISVPVQETGGGYVALSQLYGRVALSAEQYNLSQKTLADLTRVTAQSLRLSGATAQESASATLQLSQALGAGTLRSEEFRAVIVAETFLSTIIFIVFIKP